MISLFSLGMLLSRRANACSTEMLYFSIAAVYSSINSSLQKPVRNGKVGLLLPTTYLLQQNVMSSSLLGSLLYFCKNSQKYFLPLKSFSAGILNLSSTNSSHFLLPQVDIGLKVLGLICTSFSINSSAFLSPQDHEVFALGRGAALKLQLILMSAADFWASMSAPNSTISSMGSFWRSLGKSQSIFSVCSFVASPSIGTNLTTVSKLATAGSTFSAKTSILFWQRHLRASLKFAFWVLLSFLNPERVFKTALVLVRWSQTPLSIGQPSNLTISIKMCMLYRWNLKVSRSEGWFKNPLFTQYHTATSEFNSVVTNWARPHKEAIVKEFFSLNTKCSLAFFSTSLRYWISCSFMMYQIAAKNMFKLPKILPSLNIFAIVKFPTFTCDLSQPRGIPPKSCFWVKGFLKNLSEYFTPMQFDSLDLSFAFTSGQFNSLNGQAEISSTIAFSKPTKIGSPTSTKIWGTSISRRIGHSTKFVEMSVISTPWSIFPSFASFAIAILFDFIWFRSYFPLKSPHKLMRWLTLTSSSEVKESEKQSFVIFLATSNAGWSSPFCKNSLNTVLTSASPFFFESSLTILFFMTTSWFFKGMFPSLPMLRAMMRPSILSKLASKFSKVISSRVSRILQSSGVY